MAKLLRLLTAVAAIMAPTAASARWVEATTNHFIIYSELSRAEAAGYAQQLERFDEFLRKIANVQNVPDAPLGRVTLYILPGLSDVQSVAHSSQIAGFYNADAQGTLAVLPLTMPPRLNMSPTDILFHEYTHHILLSSTQAHYPGWVQEGLAEFFGTATFKGDGTMVLGAPPQDRGWALHRQYQMDLDELLTADGKKLEDEAREDLYARGWLLTHYLMLSGKRPGEFDKYLKLVSSGIPSLEAGKQAFGDLDKLNGELNVYNRIGKFPLVEVPPSQTHAWPVKTRELTDCEARILPIRIRSAVGVDEKSAPRLVEPAREVQARCPNDAFVQRALAEIEFDAKNNDQSMSAADRALQVDPRNIMGMVYKGRVYARRGDWADARSWFVKANRENPDYALPLVLYYDSFMRAGQTPTPAAMTGLLRAIILAPQDEKLRLRVAYALIRKGDFATAKTVLAPAAYSAEAKEDNAALSVLKDIERGADAKTVLAEADKAKWAEIGKE